MTVTESTQLEQNQLQDYELIFIVSPEVGDDSLEVIIDSLSKSITGGGGIISNVERWGRRKLAYTIKRFMEGSYVLIQFKSKPELSKGLESSLRISEEVLRHLLVKISSK